MSSPQTEAPPHAAAATESQAHTSPRPMQPEDLLRFAWAADPQISPDGARVAFTRVHVDAEADEYRSALWVISSDGGAARALTFGPFDSQPRWSPDGRTLAFVRKKDAKAPPQLWVLAREGGEARERTSLAKGAASPAWSPDGKRLAFLSATHPALDTEKKEEPKNAPARIVTRPEWRMNGEDFRHAQHLDHVWVADAADGAPRPPRRRPRRPAPAAGRRAPAAGVGPERREPVRHRRAPRRQLAGARGPHDRTPRGADRRHPRGHLRDRVAGRHASRAHHRDPAVAGGSVPLRRALRSAAPAVAAERRAAAGHRARQRRGAGGRGLRRPASPGLGLGLGINVVRVGLLAVGALVVQEAAVRRPAGVSRSLAGPLHRPGEDPADGDPQRGGLAHADRPGRDHVPRAPDAEEADGDGAFPGREPRALAQRRAVAPAPEPAAPARLVRQAADGRREAGVRPARPREGLSGQHSHLIPDQVTCLRSRGRPARAG